MASDRVTSPSPAVDCLPNDLTFAYTEADKDPSLTAAQQAAIQSESIALLALE